MPRMRPRRLSWRARTTGTSGSVRAPLDAAGWAAHRRSRVVIVRTAEHGHSRKGRRGTLFRLGVS
jgi:hypothetical protein